MNKTISGALAKVFLLTLALTFGTIKGNAQKFALIDMEYVLKNIPAYERANEQLNQVSKKWQAEVEALNTEAATMYKNYQNEMVFLSQEQKKSQARADHGQGEASRGTEEKVFLARRRAVQKASKLDDPHTRRDIQRGQGNIRPTWLQLGARPRFRYRDYLWLAQNRHIERGVGQIGLRQMSRHFQNNNNKGGRDKQAVSCLKIEQLTIKQ